MWLFFSDSFISVVADRDSQDKLLVRARVQGHIEALFPKAKVFQLQDADYRYRALISRKAMQQAISKQIASIKYDNFKNSIADPQYHFACRDVWGVMLRLQIPSERSNLF